MAPVAGPAAAGLGSNSEVFCSASSGDPAAASSLYDGDPHLLPSSSEDVAEPPQDLSPNCTPCAKLQARVRGQRPRVDREGVATATPCLGRFLAVPEPPRSWSFLLGSCHRLSLPLSWPTCPGLSVLPSSDACTPPGQNRPLGLLQNRPPTLPSLFCFKDFLCFLLSFSVPSFHPF